MIPACEFMIQFNDADIDKVEIYVSNAHCWAEHKTNIEFPPITGEMDDADGRVTRTRRKQGRRPSYFLMPDAMIFIATNH